MTSDTIIFTPKNKYKEIEIEINNQKIKLEIPENTTWVMIERHCVSITNDKKEPILEPGFYDGHNNEWYDYPMYNSYNKEYLGRLNLPCGMKLIKVNYE